MWFSTKTKIVLTLALSAIFLASLIPTSPSEDHIRARVVQLSGMLGGFCTGEQVRAPSGKDYILTAAHCRNLAIDGLIFAQLDGGKLMLRRIVAEDRHSDLLLLEGMPNLTGLEIAPYTFIRDEVRTFTHGHGYPTYRTEGVIVTNAPVDIPTFPILGKASLASCLKYPKYHVVDTMTGAICVLSVPETVTTAMVVPGSSGGPVVNSAGKLVGVVSAVGDGFGFLVRLSDITRFLKRY